MGLLARLRSFWRNALHRSNMERDMSDELQFHLAARANDLWHDVYISGCNSRTLASGTTLAISKTSPADGTTSHAGTKPQARPKRQNDC